MTARVLVVDDIVANVKLLEARLTAEYFEVVTAINGPEALEICARGQCDIVLLDVMMPGMDGFEVCRRLKANPRTAHIPVVMVTALDQPADRVAGLEAGADDFLTKPVDDIALITRVKSLVRLKMLTDELMMRAATSTEIGLDEAFDPATPGRRGRPDPAGRGPRRRPSTGSARRSAPHHTVDVEPDPQEALFRAAEGDYDLAIVSLNLKHDRRPAPLLAAPLARPHAAAADPGRRRSGRQRRGCCAASISASTTISIRPVDRNEMLARVRTQVRRKRFSDRLRDNVQMTIEMAVTDGLTGLHNRRYLERHLATLVQQARRARASRCRCWSSTSTTSSRSTTATAMPPATRCCANSRAASARRCAASTLPAGSAARSSSSPCRTPTRRWRCSSPSGCARRSPASVSASPDGDEAITVTVSIGIASLIVGGRHAGVAAEARRRGALPRQARRPQPGRGGRLSRQRLRGSGCASHN